MSLLSLCVIAYDCDDDKMRMLRMRILRRRIVRMMMVMMMMVAMDRDGLKVQMCLPNGR